MFSPSSRLPRCRSAAFAGRSRRRNELRKYIGHLVAPVLQVKLLGGKRGGLLFACHMRACQGWGHCRTAPNLRPDEPSRGRCLRLALCPRVLASVSTAGDGLALRHAVPNCKPRRSRSTLRWPDSSPSSCNISTPPTPVSFRLKFSRCEAPLPPANCMAVSAVRRTCATTSSARPTMNAGSGCELQ